MYQKLNDRIRRDESGFTLVELLVVIVILGILAAIVVFSVRGINDKGEESACKTDVNMLTTAQEANFAQNDEWAASEAALITRGFITTESKWWNIGPAGGGQPYTLVLAPDTADEVNPCRPTTTT
jgi:prepilin-type N-terminal cleavage/methylation domain-containing protein